MNKKEWKDVKDAGKIERLYYELDCLKDGTDMLRSMADSIEKGTAGTMAHEMLRMIARSIDGDAEMIKYDIRDMQEKPVQPKGDIVWVQIPVWRSDLISCSHYDNSDKYEREWYDYMSNCGVNEGYHEEWFGTQEFYDTIYAEIMAAIVVTRNSNHDKMLEFNEISPEAVAWAYELLIDHHYER